MKSIQELIELTMQGEDPKLLIIGGFSEAVKEATVEYFYTLLTSYLTQYDKKQAKGKYYNMYALGQYFQASGLAEKNAKQSKIWKSSSEDDVTKFRQMVNAEFEDSFSPLKRWNKQLDKYLESGKVPKLTSK